MSEEAEVIHIGHALIAGKDLPPVKKEEKDNGNSRATNKD